MILPLRKFVIGLIAVGLVTATTASAWWQSVLQKSIESPVTSCNTAFFGTSSITFTNLPYGADDTDRLLVLGIAFSTAAAGESISSVTVGGEAATSVAVIAPPAEAFITSLWRVRVPVLTSGDVDIVATGTINTATVNIYRVITSTDVPSDTATDVLNGFGDPSVMIDILANSVAIGIATTQIGAEFTWTGLIEDCKAGNSGIVFGERSTASLTSLVQLLNHVVTINTGGLFDQKKLAVGTWPITSSAWILTGGLWNDGGIWIDGETWMD